MKKDSSEERNNSKIWGGRFSSSSNKLMEELSSFYQEQLKTSAAKKKVVDYAKNRGVSGSIAKRFELGFAPPGWTNLFDYRFAITCCNEINRAACRTCK